MLRFKFKIKVENYHYILFCLTLFFCAHRFDMKDDIPLGNSRKGDTFRYRLTHTQHTCVSTNEFRSLNDLQIIIGTPEMV